MIEAYITLLAIAAGFSTAALAVVIAWTILD